MEYDNKARYESFRENHPKKIDIMLTDGVGAHFHHQIEILCVSSGKIRATINKVSRILVAGEICISDSYDIHSYELLEKSTGYVIIVPKYYLPDYSSATKNLVLDDNFISSRDIFDIIEPLVKSLYNHLNKENEIFNKGIVSAIMGLIYQSLPYKKRLHGDKDNLVRDILNHIYENFDKPITLDSLSKFFGYTPNHFSHLFNLYTGIGLKDYINNIRCENAAFLLSDGANVTDAAMNSGFDSMRTFYRAFSKQYGVAPKAYTKK